MFLLLYLALRGGLIFDLIRSLPSSRSSTDLYVLAVTTRFLLLFESEERLGLNMISGVIDLRGGEGGVEETLLIMGEIDALARSSRVMVQSATMMVNRFYIFFVADE